jgi:hypothetical protein
MHGWVDEPVPKGAVIHLRHLPSKQIPTVQSESEAQLPDGS